MLSSFNCLRISIQNISVHLNRQYKLELTLIGLPESGCGLIINELSVIQMHGEMKGQSPGAAYNRYFTVINLFSFYIY